MTATKSRSGYDQMLISDLHIKLLVLIGLSTALLIGCVIHIAPNHCQFNEIQTHAHCSVVDTNKITKFSVLVVLLLTPCLHKTIEMDKGTPSLTGRAQFGKTTTVARLKKFFQ